MGESFVKSVAAWQSFYALAGAASATRHIYARWCDVK